MRPVRRPAEAQLDLGDSGALTRVSDELTVAHRRAKSLPRRDTGRPTLPKGVRLRPRSRFTRALSKVANFLAGIPQPEELSLTELVVRRAQNTPTSPSRAGGRGETPVGPRPAKSVVGWFNRLYGSGVKVAATHLVTVTQKDEEDKVDYFVSLEIPCANGALQLRRSNHLTLSLCILSKLLVYMAYRHRSVDVLQALRAKFSQYSKELGLNERLQASVVHGTVATAFLMTHAEKVGLSTIVSAGGDRAIRQSAGYKTGDLSSPIAETFWPRLLLRWQGFKYRWSSTYRPEGYELPGVVLGSSK